MLLEYGARNLLVRKKFVLPTIAAIAATASAVMALFSIADSMERVVKPGGDDTNMVVAAKGTMMEQASSFSLEDLGQLQVAPGIAKVAGAPEVSAEYVSSVWMDQLEPRIPRVVRVRGVDPVALNLHTRVHITQGHLPLSGERGVIVGRFLLGRFAGLEDGGVVRLGRHQWPVLGVLDTDDPFGSELWVDRSALMDEFHHPAVSVAYARLEGIDRREDFVQYVQRMKGLEAMTQDELGRRRLSWTSMDKHVWTMRVLCVLLALGAIIASLNALHGSLQSRLRELATLRAIGYTRGRVLLLALQESFIISLCAAAIGLPCAALIQGRTFAFGALFYSVRLGWSGLLVGIGAIVVIALLGGLLAAMQIRRMNVLVTLRDA
jgi:putative ABC transport system permease protein